MKSLVAIGNKSVVNTMQKTNRSVDPEVGELTNYSMTYGIDRIKKMCYG